MGKKLCKFNFDHWVDVEPTDLEKGDIFCLGDVTAVFESLGRDGQDRIVLHSEPLDRGPITLCLGERGSDWEFIAMAMDHVGSSCESFPDGTAIIAEFEDGNTYVYSPRLPVRELNQFCERHLKKYFDFYEVNSDGIDDGKRFPIDKFWLEDSA